MITYLKEDYPKLAERLAVPDEQLDKEICKALELLIMEKLTKALLQNLLTIYR